LVTPSQKSFFLFLRHGNSSKIFFRFYSKQIEQYKALEELYKEWNEKINVISRKDIDSLYEKHILHSLAIAAAFDFRRH
jgi:16S rRNA (guanine527-N7)-methyltransferase